MIDDFGRALEHARDAPPAVSQGLAALQRKLVGLLAGRGVRRLDSIGEPFDPRFHEAIGTVDSGSVPSGSIAEVLQDGYVWNQEVLRPARVRVAQ